MSFLQSSTDKKILGMSLFYVLPFSLLMLP